MPHAGYANQISTVLHCAVNFFSTFSSGTYLKKMDENENDYFSVGCGHWLCTEERAEKALCNKTRGERKGYGYF